jgi:hypothetical protein
MGSYFIDPETKVVMAGPYEGELAGFCSEISGTMRIPGVIFSKDEAESVRTRLNFDKSSFHLDIAAPEDGTYCFYYRNPAVNRFIVDNFDCGDVGESWNDVLRGNLPFAGESRCAKVKNAVSLFVPQEEQGALQKLWDGFLIGAGFAASAMTLNALVKRLTGRSIVDRFGNGRGPKGPDEPGTPAGGPPPKTSPQPQVKPVPEEPQGMPAVRMPDLASVPPPEPANAALFSFLAGTAMLMAGAAKSGLIILEKAFAFASGILIIVPGVLFEEGRGLNAPYSPYNNHQNQMS